MRNPVGDDRAFDRFFNDFRARRTFDRAFALDLRAFAADPAQPWHQRRVATLMLEHVLLAGDDLEFWLGELGIRDLDAASLRRRLARNARVHQRLRSSAGAAADFRHLAGRECRLTLGRWLFGAQEVFARIDAAMRSARGLRCRPEYGHGWVDVERNNAVETLPPLERDLVIRLGHNATTRWIGPNISSEINSLVEHPLGTVVTTIKPPGSDREIEIKRTGIRGPWPLDVIYDRDGYVIPPSHHLQGGSMEDHLGVETSHSSVLSRLFRLVHGYEAPMCLTIHLANVYMLPSPVGEVDILDYFTDPEVFGEHYPRMRRHMNRVTADLARAEGRERTEKVNDLGLTIEFLGICKPAQAVQIGTTSYRLERLELYLGDEGDRKYFGELRTDYTRDDSRRFADELLDEILCIYEPPRTPFRSYRTYLDAAFKVPANRERADRNYLSVMGQIGRFWGTMLAARGHSHGESFVGRNCGLRSVFEDGEWRIRIIFMDHDSLIFASRYEKTYSPRPSVRAATRDARFILGESFGGKNPIRGEVDFLRDIYRVTPAVERRGMKELHKELKAAYDKTQHAMRNDPEVHRMFEPEFVEKLGDWDEAVRMSRNGRRWKSELTSHLTAKGYGPKSAASFVEAIEGNQQFLKMVGFIYDGPGAA